MTCCVRVGCLFELVGDESKILTTLRGGVLLTSPTDRPRGEPDDQRTRGVGETNKEKRGKNSRDGRIDQRDRGEWEKRERTRGVGESNKGSRGGVLVLNE